MQLRDGPAAAGLAVREELMKFHQKWYSAHLMRLCVVGRQSLDDLEGWVRDKFTDVKRNDTAAPVFDSVRFGPEQLGTVL